MVINIHPPDDDDIPAKFHLKFFRSRNGVHGTYGDGVPVLDEIVENGKTIYVSTISLLSVTTNDTGEYTCFFPDRNRHIYKAKAVVNIIGCPDNFWGMECSIRCDCYDGNTCDRDVGCLCSPGRIGEHCENECDSGWYGINCAEKCQCLNNGECDVRNGECSCMEGTCGTRCQQVCTCKLPYEISRCNASNQCICEKDSDISERSAPFNWALFAILISVASIILVAVVVVIVKLNYGKKKHVYQKLSPVDLEIEQMLKVLTQKFNRWEIPRPKLKINSDFLLGHGEYGHVEQAELQTNDENIIVAAKSLISENAHLYNYRDFCREVETLVCLRGHPHIINFLGVIATGDPKYIVVEYASNGDLLEYVSSLQNSRSLREEEQNLINFTKHVTYAMGFMKEKKIVHRDLAARNILITDGNIAKIGDFGLSRNVNNATGRYEKVPWAADQGPLPLKWMPVEFLTKGIFKSAGDVWSFGVLLWEVASLSETPFQDVPALQFYRRLASGERLDKPRFCTDKTYKIMRRCWQSPIQLRPSPEQVTQMLDGLNDGNEGLFIHENRQ